MDWDAARRRGEPPEDGLPLAAAARLDWDVGDFEPDLRRDYGETRWRVRAPLEGRLYVCVFTLRNGRRRIISLRKANLRERRSYGNRTKSSVD